MPKRKISDKPLVVASFFPIYDFTREIAGDDFDVQCLTPPGKDPHNMSVTTSEARLVADADLVLLLGLGIDGWVERLARAEGNARVIEVHESLADLDLPPTVEVETQGPAHSHHAERDPHVWLDPLRASRIVDRISKELIALRPDQKPMIQERTRAYQAQLDALDHDFQMATDSLTHRDVVTFHDAFGYLFSRYHLNLIASVEPFPGREPSISYIKKVVDLMRNLDTRVVFTEPQLTDRPAQIIAQEIHGRVERLDPLESILVDAPHATYLERQRKNLQALISALSDPQGGNP